MKKNEIIIGTRASKLALFQSNLVLNRLKEYFPKATFKLKEIKTKGDLLLNQNIESSIEKGFFVREIQKKLLDRKIDIAVHSMKDLPVDQIKGLKISAILKRDNHRDAFLSKDGKSIYEMPHLSTIATSSNRRKSLLLKLNPKIKVISIRGNIDTRISKMKQGYCNGLVLAAAGLERLSLNKEITNYFNSKEMLCAPAQGAIAVEIRDDNELYPMTSSLNHKTTSICVNQEREFLKHLKGGCTAPIGAYAKIKDGLMIIKGIVSSMDGKESITDQIKTSFKKSDNLGVQLAESILSKGGEGILSKIR
tara:strand:+ start:199 stop:1119 length:921 start_codon:yes stop_codon:yes gene_type:complete